jgi:voltage-gated potassium channel
MNSQPNDPPQHQEQESRQARRWEFLRRVNDVTERPMIALSMVWLLLLILEFTLGLNPFLTRLTLVIWAVFIADFLIEFTIAPRKGTYLKGNWLTLVSLALPALRVVRAARLFWLLRASRAGRPVLLVRLLTSLNRGMRALGATFSRRGIGYLLALTTAVLLAGAAGIGQFERGVRAGGNGLESYGEALWWTAMLMTTIGSDYWPVTAEGRILAWLLSLYGLATFGYLTATIASHFISADSTDTLEQPTRANSAHEEVAALRDEIGLLRAQLASILDRLEPPADRPERRLAEDD